jgi:hypothetical protein
MSSFCCSISTLAAFLVAKCWHSIPIGANETADHALHRDFPKPLHTISHIQNT